jgi:hypothetical protein
VAKIQVVTQCSVDLIVTEFSKRSPNCVAPNYFTFLPFLYPNIPLSTLFSDSFKLSSSFRVTYRVSHPHKFKKTKAKVKVKLSLCFNWAPRHEGIVGEWKYSSTHSLTSALDEGEWSASRPGRFTPQGKSVWYPLDRKLGGPQNRSRRGGEEKNSQPQPGIEP